MDDFSSSGSFQEDVERGRERICRMIRPKPGGLIAGAVFLILAASMGIASLITGRSQAPDPILFDPTSGSTAYAYTDAQLLTECFAYSEEDGRILERFYFMIDAAFNQPCIVRLSDSQYDSLQALVTYTYSDAGVPAPAPARLVGLPMPLEADLIPLAISSFNEMWSTDYVTEENIDSYLGSVFLDCTTDPIQDAQSKIQSFGILFALTGLAILLMVVPKFRRENRRIKDLPDDPDAQLAYAQLAVSDGLAAPPVRLFITRDYAIGFTDRLQIVLLDDIRRIYTTQIQTVRASQYALIVETDRRLCLATVPLKRKHRAALDQTADRLHRLLPEARFGYSPENRTAMAEEHALYKDKTEA